MSDFSDWLDAEYVRMAGEYRATLERKCIEFERCCSMFKCGPSHFQIAVEALREVRTPSINKYPNPTEADKEYFKTAHKPDWADMLQQAIKRCQGVNLVNKV